MKVETKVSAAFWVWVGVCFSMIWYFTAVEKDAVVVLLSSLAAFILGYFYGYLQDYFEKQMGGM